MLVNMLLWCRYHPTTCWLLFSWSMQRIMLTPVSWINMSNDMTLCLFDRVELEGSIRYAVVKLRTISTELCRRASQPRIRIFSKTEIFLRTWKNLCPCVAFLNHICASTRILANDPPPTEHALACGCHGITSLCCHVIRKPPLNIPRNECNF